MSETQKNSAPQLQDIDRPYTLWIIKVERQQRIRFSADFGSKIPWLGLNSGNVECLALVGPEGGLRILPQVELEAHLAVEKRISRAAFSVDEGPPELIDWARYAATTWTVTFRREKTRYELTLPVEARKLGLVPSRGGMAAIFVVGSIVEVWPAELWREHVQKLARDVDQLRDNVLDVADDDSGS